MVATKVHEVRDEVKRVHEEVIDALNNNQNMMQNIAYYMGQN